METRTLGLLMAVLTGLLWATLAIALRQALHYASTGTIVWFRMVVAFFSLLFIFLWKDRSSLRILKAPSPLLVGAGLGLALNYYAYMRGLELTSASNAQIMIQLGPLGLFLIGIFHFKERLARLQVLGLLGASLGFALFFWDQIRLALGAADQYILGDLWLVIAAIGWAFFAGVQKSLMSRWSPQQFNLMIYAICLFALLPLAKINELSTWSGPVWLLMLALGLNTVFAYGAFGEALKRIPASHVSVIIAANPLLTILLVTWLGHWPVSWVTPEPIAWRGFLGGIFVVLGVILTVWRPQVKREKI